VKGTLGKVLEVDLSSKTVEVRPIEDKTMYDYLGGLGLATRLLFDQTRPQIDALSEENVLVIAPGLLVSSGLPLLLKPLLPLSHLSLTVLGEAWRVHTWESSLRKPATMH